MKWRIKYGDTVKGPFSLKQLATLILSRRQLEQFAYDPDTRRLDMAEGTGKKILLQEQRKWTDSWLVEKFVHWLDGGEPMETNVEANLQSVALIFAAIESSRTGQPIKVQEFLSNARANLAVE